jgi:hypothetical protein
MQQVPDAAHWSSASSPEEPVKVDTYFASTVAIPHANANAKVTAKGMIANCGFMCHGTKGGRNCRKVIKGHNRGAVCPDCMDESLYLQCANGCLAYVHVGCADSAPHWTCSTCRAKVEEAARAEQSAKSSTSSEDESESAAGDIQATETVEFENYTDCHRHLRENHFVIKKKRFNKQMKLTHVDYICEKSICHAKLTVRCRAGDKIGGDSDAWLAPLLIEHQVGTLLALHPTSSVCTITTDCLFRKDAGTNRNSSKKPNSP